MGSDQVFFRNAVRGLVGLFDLQGLIQGVAMSVGIGLSSRSLHVFGHHWVEYAQELLVMHDHIGVCPGEATEDGSTGGHAELAYNAHGLSVLTIVRRISSCCIFFIVFLSLVLSFVLLPLIFTTLFELI